MCQGPNLVHPRHRAKSPWGWQLNLLQSKTSCQAVANCCVIVTTIINERIHETNIIKSYGDEERRSVHYR
jgi:hypothetical protein